MRIEPNIQEESVNCQGRMDPITSAAAQSAMQNAEAMVKRQLGYIFNYKDKFKEVEECIEMLDDNRKKVQNEVNDAKKNGEEIEDGVQHWLKQVDEKIKKYESFINDERHAQTRCSFRVIFPNNLWLRYRLGRNATKMVEEIKADGHPNKRFDKVSYRLGPSSDAALLNTGYESFGSRNETIEKIMKALEDSTVNIVGVYGAGGMGKTTLVKEVANKSREKKLFNMVVMANVTRIPDIEKIQGQIAEMLGMRLEEESEIVRADRIRKRLMNEKENTLIILDDLWDGLNLNILGIPRSEDDDGSQQDVNDLSDFGYHKMEKEVFSADFHTMKKDKLAVDFNTMKKGKLSVDSNMIKKEKLSGDHKGCKILLTSRSKEVICNKMDVQERSTFSVGVLDENEAKSFLKKLAGIHAQSFDFDEKVIEIAKMCDGFPMALVSIGRALKNKSSFVWQDVCQRIKRQSFTQGHESIEFSVNLSYEHLKNEQLKHIFLLCARMGNDALIMDLVKFCIGLGLLQGVHTIREARNKVNMLIEELKESTLLVESLSHDRFNMHDIVRDVALSISSKEKHVFFMKNGIVDEWPHKDELERYTAICLHFCDINDGLPESIHCPRLEVLHIDSKDDFLKIPDDFFKDMIELRVLILTGVNLSCLPSSFKCLKKLRMLSLERCTLGENLSVIGELKKLRILTLSGSNIESLPLEFGRLDKLQLFDISNCSKLRVIPSNIISKMNSLEEFYLRDSLILWEAEENIQSQNASLSELRHLNQLQNLDVHIQSVSHFPQNLFLDILDSYKIVIGEFNMLTEGEFKIPDMYDTAKFLALNLKEGIDIHSETWVKMLFKSVEYLLLGELNDVHDVFYELNVEGFPYLKHLSIVNNFGIQYIINSVEWFHPFLVFPKLESMCLYKLDNLEKICGNNQLEEASFCRLKVIKIKTCDKLENIFPFFMVGLLTMLEEIEVCDCDSLKEIVSVERQTHTINDDKIEFPQLRLLTLKSLPAFACLYTNDKMPCSAQSSEVQGQNRNKDIITEVEQGAANSCISLFNEKVSIPKLEWLELSSINIQKIWNDQSQHCFQNLLTLNVTDCGDLKYLLSFSMAGSLMNLQSLFVSACEMMEDIFCPEHAEQNIDVFPKLKKMEIVSMEKLNTIWQPHIGLHSFHSLDSLIIGECHKLVTIFPSYMEQRFQSLQSLTITNCQLVENIFDFENIPQTGVRNETNLQNVFLKALPNLVHIWKEDRSEILKYNNLKSISINESPNLKHLFPLSVATDLEKLEILDVYNCRAMKEIVAWDNGSNENAITFKFPQLNTVSLQNSFELVSFYRGTHTLEWPSLKKLSILNCFKLEGLTKDITNSQGKPIVSATEKVIYNLESMEISLKEAEWLQKYSVSVHRMHKLQRLVLYGLKNTEILFWFLRRLPNLKSLTMGSCHLKSIWAPASLISRDKIGVVMQLKELELKSLLSLEEIGFEHHPLLQRIERLVISRCMKLTNLASSIVSYNYITHLEVTNCRSLRNLMTSSTAKSLVQLTTMKVFLCEMIVEIVAENAEEKVQEIEFRQLKSLELVSLKNLTSFCSSEKCDFKFPLLESLVVSECPQMKKFSRVQSAPNLKKVHVVAGEKDKWYWEGDLNGTLQKHFTDQVSFEYSKHKRLVDYPETKGFRHGKPVFRENFFGCLKKLEFDGESIRQIVIPSHVLPYLKTLEELYVHNSDAVQIIFDMDHSEAKTKGIVSRLKKLTLEDLSNLECVWNKNPRGILSFPHLQQVVVTKCRTLATLFPLSLARNLGKLKILEIQFCDKLVEIVGKEDVTEHATTEMFEFPCLWILLLHYLSMLSCFYPGKHRLECPFLTSLYVSYCPKLKLFTSEFHNNHKEAVTEAPISRLQQNPLFSVDKILPNLKKLTLNVENIMLLSDARLPQDLLFKLNFLALSFENDDNKKDTLPFDFLQKVPSLEHLFVQSCYGLKEIFPSQKLQVHDRTLPGLKQLSLSNLGELESIGLEHPWVKPYSQKLQLLKLWWCPQLEKLVSCAVSFINLKQLQVTSCDRMEYLLKCSTAKSLLQLESLSIRECESMKEIVKKEEEDASHEIIFGRLRTIMLDSLPRLVRFYSGNATLHFTCLRVATIAECLNMETFSEGIIEAPLLEGIKTSTEDTDHLTSHHDLNTTIETLFHQQVEKSASDIENLKFGDHHHLEEIWLGVVPIPSNNCFNSLKSLIVVECESLSNVIPFYLLRFLCNLKEIEVSNCQSVKAIFDMEGTEADMKPASQISLPLKKLILNQLPNLEHIWNLNPDEILSFQEFQEVCISNCQSLKSLFPTSVASHLAMLDVRSCATLEEIFVENEAVMKGETKQFNFHCLTTLTLWELPELKYFYNGKHLLEWPMLTQLDVYHCDKLKLFTTEHQSGEVADIEYPLCTSIDQQAVFSVEKVMPSLEHQANTCKDNMIGQGQFVANAAHLLQHLKVLKLMCYHEDDESNIFSSGLLEEISSIENLEVFCSSFNEIFSCQTPSTNYTKVLSKLKKLHLKSLQQLNSIGLEHSWVEPLPKTLETLEVFSCPSMKILVPSTVSFSNLTSLNVEECHGLVYLFTSSTAKRLGQLKHMSLRDCQAIQEIVSKEGDHESNDEVITFEQLRVLSLESLPSIVGIYSGKYKLKFPSLDQMLMHHGTESSTLGFVGRRTTLMDHAATLLFHLIPVVDPNLKELTLNEENIILLRDAHLPHDFLCKLNILDLSFDDYENKKNTLPFDFLHKVPNVKCLRVQRCYGLKEIFPSQKLQVHHGILGRLNELFLKKLKELESIGLEHPWVKPYSAKLKILEIRKCSLLEKVVSCAVSFISLKELQVSDCERMEYLFTSSTAKSLVQLKMLYIEKCESIKEIVRKEDESDASEEIIFGRLTKLRLESLGRLVRFYSGDGTLQFSCLEEATIAECPNMNTFSEGFVNAPMFEGIKTSTEDSDLKFRHDLNSTIKMLFHQQVEKSACDIEHLKFGDNHHLEEIWLGVVPIPSNNCFNSLKSLTVVECESLPNVIPFYLLRFLCNLKEIEVSNCQSVKAIFDMKGAEADMKPASQISLPLKKLILNQLPNLEHIWNTNPDEILSLQEVSISNCQSLKSLFPTSVANHLAKLDVSSCATLEEIFYFYNGKHSLEWRMLTQLDVYHCDKLKLFTTENHSGEVADIEYPLRTSIDQQAVFSVEKFEFNLIFSFFNTFKTTIHSFPKLGATITQKGRCHRNFARKVSGKDNFSDTTAFITPILRLFFSPISLLMTFFLGMPSFEHQATTCKDNMIGQGQFVANAAHLLQNLKVLKLMCYHEDDESNIFSSGLLEEISSIENLEVFCSSFNEIFSPQIPITNCTKVLSKLKILHLKSLQQLNSIGLEHSWVEPILKALETLEVFSCPNMKILVPSTVLLSNLTSLNVEECHGLVYLFTSSMAKRLGQLMHMSIRDCQAIQEILRVLSLESLPSIVGIYSGKYKLKFPSLDQVTLMECPQMKYSYMVSAVASLCVEAKNLPNFLLNTLVQRFSLKLNHSILKIVVDRLTSRYNNTFIT
ncbi:putative disease resistance protein [Glycine soja]